MFQKMSMLAPGVSPSTSGDEQAPDADLAPVRCAIGLKEKYGPCVSPEPALGPVVCRASNRLESQTAPTC
jgi:hypothetical protein